MRRPRQRPEPVRWLREELPLLADRIDRRTALIGLGALAGIVLLVWLITGPLSDDDSPGETRVVTVAVETDDVGCGWARLTVALTVDGEAKSTCTVRVALPVSPDDNPWDRSGDQWRP